MIDPNEMTSADMQDAHEDDLDNPLRAAADRMPAPKPRPGRRKGDKSGKHTQTQVNLRADEDEVERWTLAAERSRVDRNAFLREAANQLADDVLGE